MSKLKNVFGMKNKKKADDSDEDNPSYTDPAVIHSVDPPSRNAKGISYPHYPPPRPCHASSSPNQRRKNTDAGPVQGNKKPQVTENNRNSVPSFPTGEPKRAPPRVNITKKPTDVEDDYCDPIDVQRKDDFIQEMRSQPSKDDYCEPWDSTMKTDPTNVSSKNTKKSDDESSEYLEPYDTGKQGFMEKRMSRGIGREFGVQHGKDQRRSAADSDSKQPVFDPSKPPSDDYDMPWEWKMKNQQVRGMVSKPSQQAQRPKSNLAVNEKDNQSTVKPSDDYDEPWERKQSYLYKSQVPTPGGKSRSPVPLPRQNHPQNNVDPVYEQPWDVTNQLKSQPPQAEVVCESPWVCGGGAANGSVSSRRFSQPNPPSTVLDNTRKISQPAVASDDYDTPWEYKNKQFGVMGPPKPVRLHEIANAQEIDPDLPLKQQEWYHGPLTRVQAEEMLRGALDCSFLVRNSESSKKDYSLSMKNNDNFLHLKIVRQLDGQYILGQFSKPFLDIPKVIHHYSINKLNIRGAEHKFLKHPVAVQPEYHTIEPEDEGDINV